MVQVPIVKHPSLEALHETLWADAGQLEGSGTHLLTIHSLNKGLKTAWSLLKLFIQFVTGSTCRSQPSCANTSGF